MHSCVVILFFLTHRSPFLVVSGGMSLYSLPYTWPEAPDQSDAIHLFTEHELSFFHHITAISYHYRSVYTNTKGYKSCAKKLSLIKETESLMEVHACPAYMSRHTKGKQNGPWVL